MIQHRPWPAAIIGFLVLLLLTVPLLSMRLGFNDAGNRPTSDTTRRAYDLVAEGFGPGFNGPLLLTAATPDGEQDVAVLQQLSESLNDDVEASRSPRRRRRRERATSRSCRCSRPPTRRTRPPPTSSTGSATT